MPYVPKKYKRRYVRKPRRKYKKKPVKTVKGLTLIKNPSIGGFPKSCFTRLKWVQSGSLNPGVVGINDVAVFRANSCYDPYQTGVGTQPRGFDQWMTIYDHFYVKRSKITVEFHNGDATNEVQCGIAIRDDITPESTANEYEEQDNKGGMLGRVGSSHNHLKVTRYYTYKGQNYAKYVCEQNKGSASSNPTEMGFFHVWAGSPWSQDAANTYYTARIEYDVLFTELKDVPPS